MSKERKLSNEDATLILNQDEQLLLDVESKVPAGEGVLYLTDQRFVFIGKKPLTRGMELSGIVGIIFIPIYFVANLISKSKGTDFIEFALSYDTVSETQILGRKKDTFEVKFAEGKSIKFSIQNELIEGVATIFNEKTRKEN